jgi:hypothetical protein
VDIHQDSSKLTDGIRQIQLQRVRLLFNPGIFELLNILSEGILMRDSNNRIASALMFGRGRFSNGIILELKEPHVFDPTDTERLAQFRNDIW